MARMRCDARLSNPAPPLVLPAGADPGVTLDGGPCTCISLAPAAAAACRWALIDPRQRHVAGSGRPPADVSTFTSCLLKLKSRSQGGEQGQVAQAARPPLPPVL